MNPLEKKVWASFGKKGMDILWKKGCRLSMFFKAKISSSTLCKKGKPWKKVPDHTHTMGKKRWAWMGGLQVHGGAKGPPQSDEKY